MRDFFARFRKKGTITIDDVTYRGDSVSISNGRVSVDGKEVANLSSKPSIHVQLTGDADSVETASGDVSITGNVGAVRTASGEVRCGAVQGSVSTVSGDVSCPSIQGKVSTVSGDIAR